jgi:hypothetical protein
MERFAMSDNPKVVSVNGTSYVAGSTAIIPSKGTPGWDAKVSNFRPYVLPGQDYVEKTNKIETPEFVIARGTPPAGWNPPVTSNKWWSPALLQHQGRPDENGWVIDGNNPPRRSQPMVSEPFRLDFVDMTSQAYPQALWPIGVRVWNQSDMYVYTGGDTGEVGDNKFSIDNLAQVDAPIVTIGLQGIQPLANPPQGKLSNVVVNNHTVFHVEISYSGKDSTLSLQAANGVPYVIFKRSGPAPFQLWAGSPVTDVGPSDNKDTYDVFPTKSPSELGFKLGMRFLPALPPGVKPPDPPPRGRAGYYVRADRGTWVKQSAQYGSQSYFTWINTDATTVWLFAVPHNVNLDDANAVQAAIDAIMAVPAKEFDSDLLYPPEYRGDIVVNGQLASTGYDEAKGKITVGYRWTPLQHFGDPEVVMYLGLLPHHRKYLRDHDRQCFPMNGNRPQYFYRTLKGEMWVYKGREFVRELDVHGLLPFLDHWSLWQSGQYLDIYSAMRTWFWTQEPVQGTASPDSFAWNYFENGGPEANPYMYGWAGIYESLIVADQLAQCDHADAKANDPDFGTPRVRVAAAMRDKILDVMKQLFEQWFDIYSAQCLQYNDKFLTMCGYPEGYFCVSHLCDHHFHWGYYLRAAAAIGRHDPAWLDRHWPGIELLIRDSANYDRRDGRFPLFRNFSAFYGHCWANGIALNNGQDQESTSEAINFAFGMVELATMRSDNDMLTVGLWLYEEQVCAAEQYWFNIDADLDHDPPADAYYNGNWPKGFVRFKRAGVDWNSTLIGILAQQAVSRQTHFGGLQGTYSIHMTPVGACNLYLERHADWLGRTYKSYLQTIHTLPKPAQDTLPYENVIAMWQAVLPTGSDGDAPYEHPGPNGAKARINKSHIKYPGALNAQGLAWLYIRNIRFQPDSSIRSNAVHYGVFTTQIDGPPNNRSLTVYNPTSQDLTGIKFWNRASGALVLDFGTCPARSLSVQTQRISDGKVVGYVTYTPSVYTAPAGRLYLRSNGGLTLQPGTAQQPNGEKGYPADLSDSDLQASVMKLGYGEKACVQFSGSFSGTLSPDFRYTRFSLFTNAGLWPGWTRDQMDNDGVGVEVKIEYDFGGGRTRTEFYGPIAKFNLQTNNTWLNHNDLTEYATTTVPVTRNPSQNPLKPTITGVEFASVQQVTQGTVKVTVWGAETSPKIPDLYLSCECSPASQRASWISLPYQ